MCQNLSFFLWNHFWATFIDIWRFFLVTLRASSFKGYYNQTRADRSKNYISDPHFYSFNVRNQQQLFWLPIMWSVYSTYTAMIRVLFSLRSTIFIFQKYDFKGRKLRKKWPPRLVHFLQNKKAIFCAFDIKNHSFCSKMNEGTNRRQGSVLQNSLPCFLFKNNILVT